MSMRGGPLREDAPWHGAWRRFWPRLDHNQPGVHLSVMLSSRTRCLARRRGGEGAQRAVSRLKMGNGLRLSEADCEADGLTNARRNRRASSRACGAGIHTYSVSVACACPRAARSPCALVLVSRTHAACSHGHLCAPPAVLAVSLHSLQPWSVWSTPRRLILS